MRPLTSTWNRRQFAASVDSVLPWRSVTSNAYVPSAQSPPERYTSAFFEKADAVAPLRWAARLALLAQPAARMAVTVRMRMRALLSNARAVLVGQLILDCFCDRTGQLSLD